MPVVSRQAGLEGALNGVEGWLYLDEARALYAAVSSLPSDNVTIVEIGSWKGRSTVALALAVKDRGAGRVFAIDPHTGEEDRTGTGPVKTLETFKINLANAHVEAVVEPLVTTSHMARSQFAERSIDLLFIDGSHQYADVRRDIEDWPSALKDSAVIAFNDPIAPGVYRALRELVLGPGPYLRPRLVRNTLFFDFKRQLPWQRRDASALRRLRFILWLKSNAVPFWGLTPKPLAVVGRRIATRMLH
jgi:MMP 1-O-methyltransferase